MYLLIFAYLAAIVAANLSVATFGPGSVIINAFVLVALDLAARDRLHVAWKGRGLAWKMAGLIGAGGLISYLLNSGAGQIAIASFTAFTLAALADALVFSRLEKAPWLVRSNSSNLAGALVDSLLFTVLAFGAFLPVVVAGQVAAKFAGGFLWSLVLKPAHFKRIPVPVVALALALVLQAFIYYDFAPPVQAGGPVQVVQVSTSPFAAMPYGTRVDCYFDNTNYFNCYINQDLTYRLKWEALSKDKPKGVFRFWATPDRQLVTALIDFKPGQQEYFYVVSPGDYLPGTTPAGQATAGAPVVLADADPVSPNQAFIYYD